MNDFELIPDFFKDFSSAIGKSLLEEHNKRLNDDEIAYKRGILLHLSMHYKTPEDAVKAGYDLKGIKNAIKVLRENGYEVDLENHRIEKNK
jgi:hypothetical protein